MNFDAESKPPLPSGSAGVGREQALASPLSTSATPQQRKMELISDAIEACGMGRYQWRIFCLCGFSYMLDLMWPQMISFVAPRIQVEFGIPASQYGDLFSVQHAGSTVGSAVCGVLVDVFGRRAAFNVTVAMISVFGLLIGALDSWKAILAVSFLLGFGLGGNIPIDATILMDFIPKRKRWLLVALSAFQRVGVIVAALISWGLVPTHACRFTSPAASCSLVEPRERCCSKASNYGWRYTVFAMGAISVAAFLVRFVLFPFHESPRFLVTYGRDEEAVRVIHAIARTNRRLCTLTVEDLHACGPAPDEPGVEYRGMRISAALRNVSELFTTWGMARLTLLTWAAYASNHWGFSISNAFLPKLLAQRGENAHLSTSATYRQYVLAALPGVPGVSLGAALIEVPVLGRRWSLVLTAAAMGGALMSFVSVRTPQTSVALNAVEYFFQAAFNAILYGWTPEAFPARMRGSATGLAGCVGRITSIVAPLVAARVGAETMGIYLAGGGVFLTSVLCAFLPDTRKHEVI
ncbi:MFS general substrate transporter [Auricularia subglabra TFB-10046 SS5]|nr:MFS general substrate transporter [Auricularia subglabra TFB-10046 SS5]